MIIQMKIKDAIQTLRLVCCSYWDRAFLMSSVKIAFSALLFLSGASAAIAEDDAHSMGDERFSGDTTCALFYQYIDNHPKVTPETNAKNAEFVIVLIIGAQRRADALHRSGKEMTPTRIHQYENAFRQNCEQDNHMTIALSMQKAVESVDANDPV